MRIIKNEAKHYLETGIAGAYETADVQWQSDLDGNQHRSFDDTSISEEDGKLVTERTMWVEGRTFTICSIFPTVPKSTPTQKILKIIDSDLENES